MSGPPETAVGRLTLARRTARYRAFPGRVCSVVTQDKVSRLVNWADNTQFAVVHLVRPMPMIAPVKRRSRQLGNWPDRTSHWKRSLTPGRRVPWLAVASDGLFHISREVLVKNRVRATGFHGCDHFGDLAPANRGRLDHGYRTVNTLPDFRTPFHRFSLVFREDRSLRDCEEIAGIAGLTDGSVCPTFAASIRYALTGDTARTNPSSLSSNSNPAVRGLWWRVYQR